MNKHPTETQLGQLVYLWCPNCHDYTAHKVQQLGTSTQPGKVGPCLKIHDAKLAAKQHEERERNRPDGVHERDR